jgi:hypothetical protein
MKHPWLILIAGLLLAAGAYVGSYQAGMIHCHQLAQDQAPELAWLREEFHLTPAEFARISDLHATYLAGCAERCQRIDEKNAHLRHLLAATNIITPEIAQTLQEAALLRADCQKKMLEQFYAVSQTMPPEQGARYLKWVQNHPVLANAHAGMAAAPEAADHSPLHH